MFVFLGQESSEEKTRTQKFLVVAEFFWNVSNANISFEPYCEYFDALSILYIFTCLDAFRRRKIYEKIYSLFKLLKMVKLKILSHLVYKLSPPGGQFLSLSLDQQKVLEHFLSQKAALNVYLPL